MAHSDTVDFFGLQFYQVLSKTYSNVYENAQKTCAYIIVPEIQLNLSSYTLDIIESHIFRPSPLYTNKYESFNRRYGIELKADNTILVSSSNFDLGKRRLRIINQEDVYNSRWRRNFTILITPTFLSDDISGVPLSATRSLPSERVPSVKDIDYRQSFVFLDSLRPLEAQFKHLSQEIFLFNERYAILESYIGDAKSRLRKIYESFLSNYELLKGEPIRKASLELMTEIYVTGSTYPKVWPVIVKINAVRESQLSRNVRSRKGQSLNKDKNHRTNKNTNAINELKKMDDLKSAHEKAICIHSALNSMVAAISLEVADGDSSVVTFHREKSAAVLDGDETLTGFIDVIREFVSTADQESSTTLMANEYYIENFHFIPLAQEIDYAFITYKAALNYLVDDSF